MKILITGASGLVGTSLTKKLDSTYHDIKSFAANSVSDPHAPWPEVDLIINLAALNSAKDSIESPQQYFDVNVTGQFNMLQAARHMGAKYLYLNSIKSHEHHPYGASKASAAVWARAYAETYDMPLVMNQVGNLYGPHGDNFWVNIFMQKAKDGEPIEVWGDGSSSRDMLYIEDLTDLLVDQIDHFDLYAKHEVIPVGGGKDNVLSLKKVLDWLDYKNVTYKPEMATLDKERVTDNTLVTSINGWRPVTTLDQGLKLTYDSINA